MTDEQWIELGQRAFACKHWRWMPGMRAIEADPEMRREGPAWGRAIDGLRGLEWFHAHGGCIEPVPDLRDPATRGCVMALVDELRLGVDTRTAADETRADALVAALEVASD